MKRYFLVLLLACLVCGSVMAGDDLTPLVGNSTNDSIVLTNTYAKRWITAIYLAGTWTSTVSVAINNGDASYNVLTTTNATSSVIYQDEADTLDWEVRGTLTLTFSSTAANTNFYRIKFTNER